MDNNQGYNPYKWVICPLTRVINLHITSYLPYPEPLSRYVLPTFLFYSPLFCVGFCSRFLLPPNLRRHFGKGRAQHPRVLGLPRQRCFRGATWRRGKSQWLFLVPVKGGRWHIIPQLAVYTTYIPLIYHLYIAFWGVICYLPSFTGTRNNHWKSSLHETNSKSTWKYGVCPKRIEISSSKHQFSGAILVSGSVYRLYWVVPLPAQDASHHQDYDIFSRGSL